jgi:competence protein ComGC
MCKSITNNAGLNLIEVLISLFLISFGKPGHNPLGKIQVSLGVRMNQVRYDHKGISLVEVLISIFLISTGILSLLSLQPSAWNLSLKSDFLGRAGSILHSELEGNQILLMNPNYPNPCSAINPITLTKTVNPSGQSIAQAGDLPFTVQTGIQDNLNSTWTVRVSVSWPGNNAGISETRVITRQESFRF